MLLVAAGPAVRGQTEHLPAEHSAVGCRYELSHLLADDAHLLAIRRVLGKLANFIAEG